MFEGTERSVLICASVVKISGKILCGNLPVLCGSAVKMDLHSPQSRREAELTAERICKYLQALVFTAYK
jgi:hypothetical protein